MNYIEIKRNNVEVSVGNVHLVQGMRASTLFLMFEATR
jgi:hypothetical protein